MDSYIFKDIHLPREMSFPLEKHEEWYFKYDHIQFPSCNQGKLNLYLILKQHLFSIWRIYILNLKAL